MRRQGHGGINANTVCTCARAYSHSNTGHASTHKKGHPYANTCKLTAHIACVNAWMHVEAHKDTPKEGTHTLSVGVSKAAAATVSDELGLIWLDSQ